MALALLHLAARYSERNARIAPVLAPAVPHEDPSAKGSAIFRTRLFERLQYRLNHKYISLDFGFHKATMGIVIRFVANLLHFDKRLREILYFGWNFFIAALFLQRSLAIPCSSAR